MSARVSLDEVWVADFCGRWGIKELSLFGSVLRDDFGPDSDVDVLVEFDPSARIGFMALAKIEDELEAYFDRRVDVVPKGALRPALRDSILSQREVVFAAA